MATSTNRNPMPVSLGCMTVGRVGLCRPCVHSRVSSSAPGAPRHRAHDPGDQDTEDIEADHRQRKERLGRHISARRDDGRGDENDQDGVFRALPQKTGGDQAHLGQEEHHGGHLEDQAHSEQHLRVETKDIVQPGHEGQIERIEAAEKRHHPSEHDVVIEQRAADEAAGRQQDEREREPLLMQVQRRRDQTPDLIHDERRGEHDAGNQRDLDVDRERFAGLRVDQLAARRQHTAEGLEHEREDGRDEPERDQHPHDNRDGAVDEPAPELLEVGEDREPNAVPGIRLTIRATRRVGSPRQVQIHSTRSL